MDKSKTELIKECKLQGIRGYSSKTKEELLVLLQNPPNPSPLRYPGGKSRAVKILYDILIREYGGERKTLISPFFGGGSFELAMHSKGYKIITNDLFSPLYFFWNCLKRRPQDLIDAIKKVKRPISKDYFIQMRKRINECTDELESATIFFVVNRCSFSGATFCGGFSREASEKRFTDSSIKRLETVDLANVDFSNLDFSPFLERHPERSDSVMYLDPPYYIDSYIYGKNGDLHEDFKHRKLFELIKDRKDWILSYNDCPFIRDMYVGFRIQNVDWEWGMSNGKKSSEIIILP